MNAMQKRWMWIGGLTAGAAALLYAGIKHEQTASAATAAGTPVSTGTLPTHTGQYAIVIAPGAQTMTVPTGQEIDFFLPAGASWSDNTSNVSPAGQAGFADIALNNTGNAYSKASFAIATSNSTITLNWTDSTGAAQTSTVTVVTQ